MFESDEDVPAGTDELFVLSYDTIDDIVTNTQTGNVSTNLGVAAGFSTTGFASETKAVGVAEPNALWLVGGGVLLLGLAGRKRSVPIRSRPIT